MISQNLKWNECAGKAKRLIENWKYATTWDMVFWKKNVRRNDLVLTCVNCGFFWSLTMWTTSHNVRIKHQRLQRFSSVIETLFPFQKSAGLFGNLTDTRVLQSCSLCAHPFQNAALWKWKFDTTDQCVAIRSLANYLIGGNTDQFGSTTQDLAVNVFTVRSVCTLGQRHAAFVILETAEQIWIE